MTTNPTRTETEQGKKGRRSRPVTLGKINLLLALLGLLLLIGAYRLTFLPETLALLILTFLPETLALLILTVSLVTVLSRAWQARRGGLEYGLLRHPFRPTCCNASTTGCSGRCLVPPSWRARSQRSQPACSRPIVALAGPDPLPTAGDLARRRGAGDGRACAHPSPPKCRSRPTS
jgi:hypothetical protein